jgi:cytidylate kinase
VTVVAMSGPDNVGKSTQVRLLGRRTGMADLGALDAHDPRWPGAHSAGLAEWWFGAAPVSEVTDVLACSYLARAASGGNDHGMRLADRGVPMLEATVVATAAVREHLGHGAAADRAAQLLAPYRRELEQAEAAETGILLLHDDDPEAGAARALSREKQASARYAAYQRALNAHLHAQARSARFAVAITVAGRSILSVQHEIGVRLGELLGLDVPEVALQRVRVVALGGLSESGKSTAGHYLATRHGYARLKIGYLLDAAAARHQIADVYALDAVGIAELLAEGLEDYCRAQHFQRRVSIESLHRANVTVELAKLLGPCLRVVYLDADAATREARGVSGPDDVRVRDAVKRSRGAEEVVGNNGPVLALYHALDRIAAGGRWTAAAIRRGTVAELRLPAHLAAYVTGLLDRLAVPAAPLTSLLAVTGSGGRGKYQEGWSDLDVLAVAEPARLPGIRAALGDLSGHLGGVKLGFTVVSASECAAGALTPRLLHTLALIGAGRQPVLWCAEGLRLPCPDAEADALASLSDGIAAVVEIRRQLLRPARDLRSLLKVTALAAKVALRAEGDEQPADADALLALIRRYPAAFPGLGAVTVTEARRDEQAAARLAGAVLDWWLSTLLPAGSAP